MSVSAAVCIMAGAHKNIFEFNRLFQPADLCMSGVATQTLTKRGLTFDHLPFGSFPSRKASIR